jgi:hypoxanthine phosphoribosyltransferase
LFEKLGSRKASMMHTKNHSQLPALHLTKLITEGDIQKRVKELGAEITKICQKEELIAVCVLKGAFVFYSDLVRNINADIRTDFLGCSSYGNEMTSSGEVKLTLDLTHSITGKNVLLVEDIIDTGYTVSFLKKTLEARNPKRLMTASLLLKPKALKVDIKPDFVGFEIGNEFVVGYGLDYQGYYRNLSHIAQVQSRSDLN